MWSPTHIDPKKPKYLAIADALELDIANGKIFPGEQLPPQRELADHLLVNLSTVSRAYKEAARRGLTTGTVGKGTFVSSDVSVNREMIQTTQKELGQIEMGLVLPLYSCDPDMQQRVIQLSAHHDLSSYAKYSEPFGLQEHLQTGAYWGHRFGFSVSPDRIVVTAGAQHALTCAFISCFKPGSRIAVDHLTYPGLKALATMMHLRLVPIEIDQQGMSAEQLDRACRRDAIEGIYLMPSCHNPTGIAMSDKRREHIIALIKRHNLLLLEDDAYYFTADEQKPALSSQLPDHSIFIAGFSKILFPGLRSAFVITSTKIRDKLASAVINTIWMAPTFNTSLLCQAIEDGTVDAVIEHKQQEAKARNAMIHARFSCPTTTSPAASFFQWCKLPGAWTGIVFEERARESGVNVFCGEKFAVGNQSVHDYIRIAVTSPGSRQELSIAISLLNETLETELWPINGIN